MATIAIIGFALESNRFAPPTRREDFGAKSWLVGADILADEEKPAPIQCAEIPAFMDEIKRHLTADFVPILVAGAEPGGPLDDAVLDEVIAIVRDGLAAHGPVDGVYLASHGAMVGVSETDPDGALMAAIRATVGPDIPVVATLDLHANLSPAMVNNTDCLIGYRTNPHVDQAHVAREAAIILARMIKGERFHMAAVHLPLSPPTVTLFTNSAGPYADCVAQAAALTDPWGNIANVTMLGGFVYSDTLDSHVSVIVTATSKTDAEREAALLAGKMWAGRKRLKRSLTPVSEAVDLATAEDGSRWILSDSGDNPGGGGRGTTTELLAALVAAQAQNVLYGLYIDAILAQEAHAVGLNGTIEAQFLRDGPDAFGAPLSVEAQVVALSDGKVTGRRGLVAGRAIDLGPTAALRIGGIIVVVASNRKQCADPAYFEHLGLDPGACRTLVVKSRGHFRAGFDEFFTPNQIIEVDTKGLTSPVLANFQFRGLARPTFPLDPETVWTPPAWVAEHLTSRVPVR
ncbi:MAG: M81 family metallopeptidase [Pseudomonadota bacterium]